MTKQDLLKLIEPYSNNDQIVFVVAEEGLRVYDRVLSIGKDHGTRFRASDGSLHLPVAVYLSGGQHSEMRIME